MRDPKHPIDAETLELLEAWAREDAPDDPEKLSAARMELDEFKRAMISNGFLDEAADLVPAVPPLSDQAMSRESIYTREDEL